MALVNGELYSALLSVNVARDLAREASRIDDETNVSPTVVKLEGRVRCLEVMLVVAYLTCFVLIIAVMHAFLNL